MSLRNVGARRLLKLAKFLRTLPPDRFDYGHWVGEDWKGAADLRCGTTACALGWATAVPSLRRLGLVLRKPRFGKGFVTLAGRQWPASEAPLRAAQVVFGVSYNEAKFLFVPGEYDDEYEEVAPSFMASAAEVAAHIEQFVTNRYKEG